MNRRAASQTMRRLLQGIREVRAAGNRLLRSWFALTGEEQKALMLVLALFLLGLAVRGCRLARM